MNLSKPTETFRYGEKQFTRGGIFTVPSGSPRERYGIILELNADSGPRPEVICGFGAQNIQALPLEDLTPVILEPPVETGKRYALHRSNDGVEGQQANIVGISESKSILLGLMLEDAKNYPHAILMSTYLDEDSDSLYFNYENGEQAEELYVNYSLTPVPVYSKAKGGDAV